MNEFEWYSSATSNARYFLKKDNLTFFNKLKFCNCPKIENFESIKDCPNCALLYAIKNGNVDGIQKIIATNAHISYLYAIHVLKGRFEEGEDIISSNAEHSYNYAVNILKNRFPKGELEIMKNEHYCLKYIDIFIQERWVEAEPFIINFKHSTIISYIEKYYKKRWIKAEKRIIKSWNSTFDYVKRVVKEKFPEGEKILSRNAETSYHYAFYILKGPFPLGEKAIAKSSKYAYNYAMNILKGRFLLAEKKIACSSLCFSYAKNVIKGEFPEAEPYICKDALLLTAYIKLIGKRFLFYEKSIQNDPKKLVRYITGHFRERFHEYESQILKTPYSRSYFDHITKTTGERLIEFENQHFLDTNLFIHKEKMYQIDSVMRHVYNFRKRSVYIESLLEKEKCIEYALRSKESLPHRIFDIRLNKKGNNYLKTDYWKFLKMKPCFIHAFGNLH